MASKNNASLISKALIAVVVTLSIWTNFHNLEKTHNFAWDQERDAEIVYERIIREKSPTLIGPRVVGPEGFHIGPLHYYVLVPFYMATSGDPIAGPIAAGLMGVLTTIGYIYLARKLFDDTAAITAGLMSALMPQLSAWNVMYMPLLTIFMYYSLYQILKKEYKFYIPALLIIALALQAHFSAIFLILQLIIVTAFVIFQNKKHFPKKAMKPSLIGLGILIASFAPLILFDVRHDFINTKLFFAFFTGNTETQMLDLTRAFTIYVRNLNIFSFTAQGTTLAIANIMLWIVAVGEGIRLYKSDRPQLVNLLIWMSIPLIALSFYSGTISEYYFVTVLSLIPLFIGSFISFISTKQRTIMVLITIGFLIITYGNVKAMYNRESESSLYHKHNLVKYMDDQNDEAFSLAYNVPLGRGFGFSYLLRYHNLIPDDTLPTPKYFIRMPPEENESGLEEIEFGVFRLSKRTE